MRIRKKKNLSPYNLGRRCRCPTLLFSIVIWDLFVYWALDMRSISGDMERAQMIRYAERVFFRSRKYPV